MATITYFFLFLCLILSTSVCASAKLTRSFEEPSLKEENNQKRHLPNRQQLLNTSPQKILIKHDEIYPPITIFPPATVTIPSANPVILTPTPVTNPVDSPFPVTNPVDSPITNPVTTPSTTTPITNPVTTYPSPTTGVPATTPVTMPPDTGGTVAAVPGGSWCVARSGVAEAAIQAALDYACGIGGADCSAIQQGASCYDPNSIQNMASFAFNSYYQKNPVQTSCDFEGSAVIITTNPSSGACVFPTSFSSSSQTPSPITPTTPTTPNPTTLTPTTTSSGGGGSLPGSFTPPSLLNPSNPASFDGTSGFGETPPIFNSSISISISLQPVIGFITLAISTVAGIFILDI